MAGMAGGFAQQSQNARNRNDDNLVGGSHGGEYRTSAQAYYTDPKTAARFRKQAAAQEAAKQKKIDDAKKKKEPTVTGELSVVPDAATRIQRGTVAAQDREAALDAEQTELDAKRRQRVISNSQNPVAISAAENIAPYKITPQKPTVKVIDVTGSFASPKSHVTKAVTLAREGYMVRIEVMPAARIKFSEYVQNQVKRLKLSKEHAERIIIAERTVKQSEKFNPDQVAVGDVSQDVRESAKGASSTPLHGLE